MCSCVQMCGFASLWSHNEEDPYIGCEIRPSLPAAGQAHVWTSVVTAGLTTVEEETTSIVCLSDSCLWGLIFSVWAFLSGSISAHSYAIYSMLVYLVLLFVFLEPWSCLNRIHGYHFVSFLYSLFFLNILWIMLLDLFYFIVYCGLFVCLFVSLVLGGFSVVVVLVFVFFFRTTYMRTLSVSLLSLPNLWPLLL